MKFKQILSAVLSIVISVGAAGCLAVEAPFSVNAAEPLAASGFAPDDTNRHNCSPEFASTGYYQRLLEAKEKNKDSSLMERTLAIALSQEGFKNYCLDGVSIDAARSEGKLWTGAVRRDNSHETGNTEYTRWMMDYVLETNSMQYYSIDWCAVFVSWCMYQAGYYSGSEFKKYYYSYCADPRKENSYKSWIESFNLDQEGVCYAPSAKKKLEAYSGWNTFVNTDYDPYDIPYSPGGLVFFNWDGEGSFFNHIGIVVSFDEARHTLRYVSGNDEGQVTVRELDFEDTTYKKKPKIKNWRRIIAYAEYEPVSSVITKTLTATPTSFSLERNNNSGITVYTNSDSRSLTLKLGSNFIATHKTGGITMSEGVIHIGEKIINNLENGENYLSITLEDGSIDLIVTVSEPPKKVIKAEQDLYEWDRASDSGVIIRTNSESELIDILRGSDHIATINSDGLDIHNGIIEISPRLMNKLFENGDNEAWLLLDDGYIPVTFRVTNVRRVILADQKYYEWEKDSGSSILISTNSGSDRVTMLKDGRTIAASDGKTLSVENGLVTILPSILEESLSEGENRLVLSFEDGLLEITVNEIVPRKEITTDASSYSWKQNEKNGLRIRTNSDATEVTVQCAGQSRSSDGQNGITLSAGVVHLSPAVLNSLLKEGRNDLTLSFPDGSADIEINMTVPEKKISTDTKSFLIRRSSNDDLVIKTDSGSQRVDIDVNSRSLSSESNKNLSISRGNVTISAALLKEILNPGSNILTLRFDDGSLEIKVSYQDDTQSPTVKKPTTATEQSKTEESSGKEDSKAEGSRNSAESSLNAPEDPSMNEAARSGSEISSEGSPSESIREAKQKEQSASPETILLIIIGVSLAAALSVVGITFVIKRKRQ